jgi:hypothetical protein
MKLITFPLCPENNEPLHFMFLSGACSSTKWSANVPDQKQMVGRYLLSRLRQIRRTHFGSEGETKAGDYIAARFKLLGLRAMGDNGTYFSVPDRQE